MVESAVSSVDGAGQVDQQTFRAVLGHFCTGVTVVTTMTAEGPVGFACQSFSALSLDPPLVVFCPAVTSRSWPAIERSGTFCVNVLSAAQQDVSGVFGRGSAEKFAHVSWTSAPSGAPVLDDVLTWVDCSVRTVHQAGDHYLVIGEVQTLGELSAQRPLLFYKGAYARTEPEPMLGRPHADLEDFLTRPCGDDWI